MLTNLTPADELADIRSRIQQLKTREAELRQGFLRGDFDEAGDRFAIEVRSQRRRRFLRDKLPDAILTDPCYWQERASQVVVVTDRFPEPVDEDFDVFEPFD